jgi:hypothetical protein
VIKILTTPLGPVSLLALMYASVIYMNLSRRLGAVTKMRPYYRGFPVAMVFLAIAMMAYVTRNAAYLAKEEYSALLLSPTVGLLFFYIPLFVGVLIDIVLVWRYWSWLLTEET